MPLRHSPLAATYVNVTTALRHNQEALEKLILLSRKGLPFTYVPSSVSGVSSPTTVAGSVAMDNAGMLVGLVLSQLVREGAPFIATATQHSILDMRTLISTYAEAERGVSQAMARYYGLPRFALGGASEAKLVDQQAAAEASLTLLVETLGGGNLIHDLGYLESGLSYSLAQLVICDEIVSWIKGYVNPIEISDETLALDMIAEYRDEGPYLESEHTSRHYRDRWYPKLFERGGYDAWKKQGSLSLAERASARVDQLLKEHQPDPLPESVAIQIHGRCYTGGTGRKKNPASRIRFCKKLLDTPQKICYDGTGSKWNRFHHLLPKSLNYA